MRIIAKGTLKSFWEVHADARVSLETWYHLATKNSFDNATDVLALFPNCRAIRNKKYVFNIKGNSYRLIVKFNFEAKVGFILFIGTHAAYDKINIEKL